MAEGPRWNTTENAKNTDLPKNGSWTSSGCTSSSCIASMLRLQDYGSWIPVFSRIAMKATEAFRVFNVELEMLDDFSSRIPPSMNCVSWTEQLNE